MKTLHYPLNGQLGTLITQHAFNEYTKILLRQSAFRYVF
jgi:hypothetical protein